MSRNVLRLLLKSLDDGDFIGYDADADASDG